MAPLAVMLAVAMSCAYAAFGPSTPAANAKRQLVLNPHAGQRLPARPVPIRVRAGSEASPFRAQLNGEPIARHFSKPRRGVRRLRASIDHGLKHGRNRLHVRVGEDSEWTRFRIKRKRHLVGAGVKRRVPVAAQAFLRGHHVLAHSRHRRNVAAVLSALRAGSGASYRWKTVAGPQHHEAGGGETRDQPSRARTRTPAFRPTLPGRYRLKLTVTTTDGTRASAAVVVAAKPPPVLPVDTMAFAQGSTLSGIKVGSTFYPPDPHPNGMGAWAQVVALKRDTLEPVSQEEVNYTIGCDNEPDRCPESQHELRDELATFGNNTLVIVASPADPTSDICANVAMAVGLETAMSRIGVAETGFDQQANGRNACGAISAIGVPGTPPGHGDWHSARALGGGGMRGLLVRNSDGKYTFEASDRVDFDTQAEASTASQSVIEVGDKSYTQSFGRGIGNGGGFQVVVLDAQTLEGDSHWFETDGSDKQALIGQLNGMRQLLHEANTADGLHKKVVFIASLGTPAISYYKLHGTTPDDELNGAVKSLVDEVEHLGGTRNGLYKLLDPGLYGNHGYSYTLVSVGGSGAANGDEDVETGISGTGKGPLNTAPVTGTLARIGPNYGFDVQTSQSPTPESSATAPAAGDPTRGMTELVNTAFGPATPWPELDPKVTPSQDERTRKQEAVKWIGTYVLGTDDPRSQYWADPDADWGKIAATIQGLRYSDYSSWLTKNGGGPPKFNGTNLDWAKAELAGPLKTPPVVGGEIGWLITTQRELGKVSKPFKDHILESWAAVQTIATEINTAINVSPDAKLHATNRALFDFLRSIAVEGIPEPAQPFAYAVNDVYEVAMELVEVHGEPAEETFDSTIAKVGDDLANRLDAEQTFVEVTLAKMIAADYSKLKTVGACASDIAIEQADCPFSPADWKLSPDDRTQVATAFKRATRIWAYGALLPGRYDLWRLPVWWQNSLTTFPPNQFYGVTADDFWVPFDPTNFPSSAQVAKPVYRNIPSYAHKLAGYDGATRTVTSTSDQWQIFALGTLQGEGTVIKPWVMAYPGASVTDALFGQPDRQHPDNLGADPETFLTRSFKPKTLDHYPEQDTPTGWCATNRFYDGPLPTCDPQP